MVGFRTIFAAALGAAVIVQDALAHSSQRNPVKDVSMLIDPTIRTPSKRVHYHSSFDLTFHYQLQDKRQEVRLALEPNHDILHDSMHINFLGEDGEIRDSEKLKRHEHKVYRGKTFIRKEGHIEWTNVGWARISLHRDGKYPVFDGAFRIYGDNHHIQVGHNYQRLKHEQDPWVASTIAPEDYMVVWRDSDIMEYYFDPQDLKRDARGRGGCASQDLEFNTNYNPFAYEAVERDSLLGRQIDPGQTGDGGGAGISLADNIGSTRGCPNTRKIALVGIATDCTYTSDFNSTESVRQNIISQVNAASEVYESSFNISLGIQNLTISDAACPSSPNDAAPWNVGCSGNTNIADRLNLFSAWRGENNDDNAFWTLLSTCNTQQAVGLAWLGQVCVTGAQAESGGQGGNDTVASANVVIRTDNEWQVFAHEAGHTFGAVHDCESQACSNNEDRMQQCCPLSENTCDADEQFIMNPSTGRDISTFSPCTVGNVCSALLRNTINSDCLTENRDVDTITGSQCGNGIVESGEDCDCGGEEECGDNNCCDPETCRFTDNSVCDPANEDCCTDQCQFASEGSVCRESTGQCDPEETCPGDSSVCPSDEHLSDGDSCGDGDDLQCASGQCTSRDQQCQAAVGARDTNNETTACEQGCQLLCRSPDAFNTDDCRALNQNFLDGTPCDNGGSCENGVCRGTSFGNDVGNWFEENQNIIIPVAASVGGLVVLALLWCCIRSCWRRMKRNKAAKEAPSPPPMPQWGAAGGGSYGPQSPPAAYGYHGHQHQHQGYGPWQNQGQGPAYPGQWQPSRTQSMRYA